MKPVRFDFFRPATLEEALQLLDRYGADARLIAGGQSLVPMMNLRIARPEALIDLACIPGLARIVDDGTHVRIGAMTRQSALLGDSVIKRHLPLLASATLHIGHFQTRRRGTVGGSLAHADPSAEIPLVMVTLGAELKLQSVRGERVIAARDFFVDALTTVIAANEMLTEIRVPVSAPAAAFAFREFSRRHGDFAIVSAAVLRSPADKRLLAGIGALGTVPHFCDGLGNALSADHFDLATARNLINAEIAAVEPISDLNASGAYRQRLASALLEDCLQQVFQT